MAVMDAKTALEKLDQAFESSSSYLETSQRKRWEQNERQFQSRHPQGSKYYSDGYKWRSKLFRPKTRSTIQSNEADCAFAFFSTTKLLDVQPVDDANPMQLASAEINRELLQYRLTKSVPWFKICIGAYQDASKNDVCAAHVYWKYREKVKRGVQTVMFPTGEEVEIPTEDVEVLEDKPEVCLIPPENLRIDPAADWTDPLNRSPYLIEVVPMHLVDVLARMQSEDPKTGTPKWKKYKKDDIVAASSETMKNDTTREERSQDGEDPAEAEKQVEEYGLVYVLRCFMRDEKGDDWFWYSLGTKKLLTDPVPASEVYWHLRYGERPYVIGHVAIEAHKAYPEAGVCDLTRDLQREVNDMTNLRVDNVKLAVLGRYGVRRNANVDYDALRLGVPGSGILMDNPQTDVQPIETKDVTASSYQEQERMDADFGDISGAFSPSSVMTNRKLGETVGGMQMISASATKIGDYRVMTFAKTFVETLFGQLIRLEQAYESDEVVLAIAARKAKIYQKYGIDQVTDDLLRQQLTVEIGVGISSTDPSTKVMRFLQGFKAIQEIAGPEMVAQSVNLPEIASEVFGAIGYSSSSRFFHFSENGDDPRIGVLQQQLQQLQQVIQTKQVEEQSRNARMQELQDKKTQEGLMREEMKAQTSMAQESLRSQTQLAVASMGRANAEARP